MLVGRARRGVVIYEETPDLSGKSCRFDTLRTSQEKTPHMNGEIASINTERARQKRPARFCFAKKAFRGGLLLRSLP